MADPLPEGQTSPLTPVPDTPSRPDRTNHRPLDPPAAPNPDRIARASIPTAGATNLESLQALMSQMQDNFQHQLQQQQRDFEVRMEALLIGKGKAKEVSLPSSSSAVPDDSTSFPSALERERSVKLEDPISLKSSGREESALPSRVLEQDFSMPASSVPERQPSHRPSYFDNNLDSSSTYNRSATKIKASDLPKFRGDKGEDVDVWIGQLSAIFDINNCSNSDIVAFLSVILKDTALKWFTRLGPKGRSQFITWAHWQDALRQRFLKANYLAEKKRLWKKRDLRQDEDMADYFDAKVDLQAYVFDENTPDSELILDILDGLPEQMHPILKSAITPTWTC